MSLEDINKLPFIDDAVLLPNKTFNEIAKEFLKYSEYCDSPILPDKITDWCTFLKCKDGICGYKFDDSDVRSSLIMTSTTTLSINKHCFDLYFCHPVWSESINWYCLGIFCFLFLIIALCMNILYIPSFTLYSQRNGTDILLTIFSACDIILIIISIYIDCAPFIYKKYESQKSAYSKFVAILIPYALPLQTYLQTMSSWILCCLLFERYLYQQHGKHAKLIFSFKTIISVILSIAIILFLFTILKFFGMKAKLRPDGGYFVDLTDIGKNDSYHNLITNWLKVPLEYFGPLLGFVSLLCLMYTSLGEQGMSMNKPIEQKNVNYKKLIKNFVIINENEREDRILISVLLMSTIAIVVKFPKFIYHIFVNEGANISNDTLHYVMISYIFLDAVFIFVKPFIYIYISPNYCASLHRYCVATCPGNQEESVGMSMTFEQTIANKMRESISYRSSIWAAKPDESTKLAKDDCGV